MDLTIAHRILGVNSFSNKKQVKTAYKKLVKKWHPDIHIDDKIKYAYAEENIKKIIESYKYLLNHNSWNKRNELNNSNNKKNKFNINKVIISFFNYIVILLQYIIILVGLPFIIFWNHSMHEDIFPYFHESIKYQNNFDKNKIVLNLENYEVNNFFKKDTSNLTTKILLNSFLELLKTDNKSSEINYIDLDNDKIKEMILKVFSTDEKEFYNKMILFSYIDSNEYSFIKTFDNGTILDYTNAIFIQQFSTFDSFYFCDSCYFSPEIINNKYIRYISPKIKYKYENNRVYYNSKDNDLNKKIINNLKFLSNFDSKLVNQKFDNGLRRLYAENISSYFYNNFDLNKSRDLFYNNYNFLDKHKIWKEIVVELIKEYPIINNKK